MGTDLTPMQSRLFTLGLTFGPAKRTNIFTIDLNDENDVTQKLREIVESANAPLIQRISALARENKSLKKLALSTKEIQCFSNMLKLHPVETKYEELQTHNGLLVCKLARMLKRETPRLV